jgi:hypothetical protein
VAVDWTLELAEKTKTRQDIAGRPMTGASKLTFSDPETNVGPVNGVDRRRRESTHCERRAVSVL